MTNKLSGKITGFLFFCGAVLLLVPFFSSCGKQSTASAAGLNTQLEILNLSPDLNPVDLYIDFKKQNTTHYTYNFQTGYFYLSSLDTPFQIRSALATTSALFSIDTLLKANIKYSIFITGLKANNTLVALLTADTASIPTIGRGKIRFVNTSIQDKALTVYANGTPAFINKGFATISKYIELPVGSYNFTISPVDSATTTLTTVSAVTIQDGRLYTLYTKGIVGHTDSAAFNAAVIVNK